MIPDRKMTSYLAPFVLPDPMIEIECTSIVSCVAFGDCAIFEHVTYKANLLHVFYV